MMFLIWLIPVFLGLIDAIPCRAPARPLNTIALSPSQDQYKRGEIIRYSCTQGFAFIDGSDVHKIVCDDDGEWSPREIAKCVDRCGNLCQNGAKCEAIPQSNTSSSYECVCPEGYVGPHCEAHVCALPAVVLHAYHVLKRGTQIGPSHYSAGSEIEYRCLLGYAMRRGQNGRRCVDGAWVPADPVTCEAVTCSNLFIGPDFTMMNGKYYPMNREYKVNSTVTFSCVDSYQLDGYKPGVSAKATCMPDGDWDPQDWPSCSYRECAAPVQIRNGIIIMGERYRTVGTVLHFVCDSGYYLLGPSSQTCQINLDGTLSWSESAECITRDAYELRCAAFGKVMTKERNGMSFCGERSTDTGTYPTLRGLVSEDRSTVNSLTIVTATAGAFLGFLVVIIAFVACQRRRFARNGQRRRGGRLSADDDRCSIVYYSNDVHLVLPSYDEAMRGRYPSNPPPAYHAEPASLDSHPPRRSLPSRMRRALRHLPRALTREGGVRSAESSVETHQYESIDNISVSASLYSEVGLRPSNPAHGANSTHDGSVCSTPGAREPAPDAPSAFTRHGRIDETEILPTVAVAEARLGNGEGDCGLEERENDDAMVASSCDDVAVDENLPLIAD